MELEHFSHTHPLTSSEQNQDDGNKIACFGCKELILGPSYNCLQCNFFLHKKCVELPPQIRHHLHRKHPLILLVATPHQFSGICICDLCNKTVESFVYSCSQCKFNLDIKCALPPCIATPESDAHLFFRLIRTTLFTCDACGTDGDLSPYVCTTCQVMVHKQCISLPRTIRIAKHGHSIKHTYFLQENELYDCAYCGICSGEVKTDYGVYYCSDCKYITHVDCAKQHVIRDETTIRDKDLEANPDALTNASMVKKIMPGEEVEAIENKQFSHEHDLTISDEVVDNKRCDGCMLPISAPVYGCAQCDIFLHKKCSELPTRRQHPLHQHLLTLLPKPPSIDGVFKCGACDQYCHGFSYNCDKCEFFLDLRCSAISVTLNHKGHDHVLCLVQDERSYGCYCAACYHGKFTYFDCAQCDFILDFGCATLPNAVRAQRYDEKHPLMLTFHFVSDKYNPDYCEICEKERDPNLEIYKHAPWFYHCPNCNISAHPGCVLGSFPYIKFGGAYSYDIHQHLLALVQKREQYPPCDNCGEPFFVGEKAGDPIHDLALQCTECNFVIHRKGPCFTKYVKQQKGSLL